MVKAETKNINFFYGNFQALNNVSLSFRENTVTALIGSAGCGKSTFLRLFNRLNDLYDHIKIEGEVLINGENIYSKTVTPDSLRKNVGMIFSKPGIFPKTVFENIAYGLDVNGVKDKNLIEETVINVLNKVALWDEIKEKLYKSAFDLTICQQQLLCIARALAVDPELILFDEPAGVLDPHYTAKIEELIYTLRDQSTIIIATHNLQQASRVSDYTAFFFKGELIEMNETKSIFLKPVDDKTQNYITGRFG